jgi:hypothetical protein
MAHKLLMPIFRAYSLIHVIGQGNLPLSVLACRWLTLAEEGTSRDGSHRETPAYAINTSIQHNQEHFQRLPKVLRRPPSRENKGPAHRAQSTAYPTQSTQQI